MSGVEYMVIDILYQSNTSIYQSNAMISGELNKLASIGWRVVCPINNGTRLILQREAR